MNKLILLIAAVAFMGNYASAQGINDDTRSQFHFGIKAGANFANVYDERGEDFRADGKLGFAGGAFFSIPIGDMFGIQPEVLLSQKGFKGSGTLLGSEYSLTRTTTFIDIPLFFAIKPLPLITILAGPQLSYLVKRKDSFDSGLGDLEIIEEFDNDNIRKNIVSGVLGLDFNFHPIVIGTRAGWDLLTNNGDGSSQTPRYKNAWIQLTLGYRFL